MTNEKYCQCSRTEANARAALERAKLACRINKTKRTYGPHDATNMKLYAIGADDGPIKFGISTNPEQRLAELQCGNPASLRVIAVTKGGRTEERRLHYRLEAHRVRGEWFKRNEIVEAEIASWK